MPARDGPCDPSGRRYSYETRRFESALACPSLADSRSRLLRRSQHMHAIRVVVLALLMVLMKAAGAWAFQALDDPIPTPIPQGNIQVKLVPVATGLVAPIYLTTFPGGDEGGGPGPGRRGPRNLYVVDQTGKVLVMKG